MSQLSHQESFWKGAFGTEYIKRNADDKKIIPTNTALFAKIFANRPAPESFLELGSNIGMNLIALHLLFPNAGIDAVEINDEAFEQVSKLDFVKAYHQSLFDFQPKGKVDCAFTKGVLIHQAPESLPAIYQLLYEASKKYILVCEYYNPSPVEVSYRGHSAVLFKRDFAGEMLDAYPDLRLVDYGFVYHRDNAFPADDYTWFLMEK